MGVFSVAGWDGSFFKVPHLCELPATQSPGWSPLGLPWDRGELLYVYRFIKQRAGMSPASICWMVGRSALPGGSSRSPPPSWRIHLAPAKQGLSLPCPCLTGVTWAVTQAETHYNFLCLVASSLSPYLSFGRGGCEAICLFLLEPVAEKCLSKYTQLSGSPQPGPPCACTAQGLRFLPPTQDKRCLSCHLTIKEWASPTETCWENPSHRL